MLVGGGEWLTTFASLIFVSFLSLLNCFQYMSFSPFCSPDSLCRKKNAQAAGYALSCLLGSTQDTHKGTPSSTLPPPPPPKTQTKTKTKNPQCQVFTWSLSLSLCILNNHQSKPVVHYSQIKVYWLSELLFAISCVTQLLDLVSSFQESWRKQNWEWR